MIFGGISKKYCTSLIAIRGSINVDSYADECIKSTNDMISLDSIRKIKFLLSRSFFKKLNVEYKKL